ncbi:RNA pyrophosphohydrolase [Nitrosococcus wardiae]|uniref:RNA pyrophosphohydrolase n=1 Tax=Nitrosococcus wardiae TaxID=1814290 RepID=A0A4V1AVV3_9GAMM|nr:RNA pyrophosphohydrolase [Nitrosococcus wardiae]QBQ54435.1 RNA pyrophosphohydrolase [Nitrosococcus wardiae]
MIDKDGFRANVGLILCNEDGRVLWARRAREEAWQFPQGGIKGNETAEEAVYRELAEEVGLGPEHVSIVGCTRGWLRYRLPSRYIRYGSKPLCIGQKQIWYLLRFVGEEQDVRLDVTDRPEFDYWRWVNYWYPLREIVYFKRKVYQRALNELAPLIFPGYRPPSAARSSYGKRRRSQRTRPCY